MKPFSLKKWGEHPQLTIKDELLWHPVKILSHIAEIIDGTVGLLSLGLIHSSLALEILLCLHRKYSRIIATGNFERRRK
jgi:hypothetical protein